jgi:hypothetical protein
MLLGNMLFTRVAYDKTIADGVRAGALVNSTGADLAVVTEAMSEEQSIFYRYFTNNSCEIAENVVGAPGWRRLLTFSAVVRNDGINPVHIGNPYDASNPWVKANAFEYSPCHMHYHFSHYGSFNYEGAPGSKRAFCLEDTNRFHNDESTPLTAIHQTCEYQGIGAGWGDEYEFGIPGQWVDITTVDTTSPHALTFNSNPDQFLCEGDPLDAMGNPVDPLNLTSIALVPTNFVTATGQPVSRLSCAFPANWNSNNLGSVQVSSPGGSFVTDACNRGQIGPIRDCGFRAQSTLRSCTPGQTVTLSCSTASGTQVLRVCEKSEALGVGVACAVKDASANAIVTSAPTTVSFTCSAVRDSASGAGGYSVYEAPILPSQSAATISCTGW